MMHKLINGNCLNIMPTLDAGSVDMVLADPPYGTTACKWDSVIPFAPMWAGIKHAAKRNAAIVMTASQPFTSALGASNIANLRYSWVWEKDSATGHLNAKRMPMKLHEDVMVWYHEKPTYFPQGIIACSKIIRRGGSGSCYGKSGTENLQTHENYPRTLIRIPRDRNLLHSTQKPVALMEYLIRTYTNPGDTVLDFAMGSGTTGVACARTGRKFIGIELDPVYFEIAKRRIEAEPWLPAA